MRPRSRWRRVRTAPVVVWRSSLSLRIISTTLLASVLVLMLGGWLILIQATQGILEGKQRAGVAEAGAAFARMDDQLRETDLRTASLFERLAQLADQAGSQDSQYHLVITGPVSSYFTRGVDEASVPQALRDSVQNAEGIFLTPTLISYTDGRPAIAGLAVGGRIHAPSGAFYPVFLLFPLNQEQTTLEVLQSAAWSTGLVLLIALTVLAWFISARISRPIRQTSAVARSIAAGNLDERVPVRGTDDLASLATSMNNMASELQKKIDQLEDLSRLQQRFVSDVSHELRTPLTTVRMASEMLYEGRQDFDPSTARATELLHAQLDRFESLLADLLEISRFDAGAAELAVETVDVVEVVRAELEGQRPLAERSSTNLRLHAPAAVSAEVDVRRVQRILRNLVSNAIEHGEGRPIDVWVGADDHTVAIAVRDRGIGFESSQAQQVFHRFWRADPARTRTVGGTGLGLSIALEDARLHDGWLQAWGRPGQGAVFRLTIPRVTGDPVRTSPLPLGPIELDARLEGSVSGG